MAITYTWKVTSAKKRNEGSYQDAIVQTYWTKTGVDENGNEGSFQGATPFTTTTMPAGSTFVPLEQLTEETILGWIQAVVVGGYEEHVNRQIQKQIDEKINVVSDAQLSWMPVSEPTPPAAPAPSDV